MLLHFTNSLSFHSLPQGMLSAQDGSHRQAHLWEPQTEGQHQFSHLVSLPATKNRRSDTNVTFSNTAKHWPHNGLTLFISHYKASFIIHFFILIPAHTIISSYGVPPCGCAILYYMLKAQIPPSTSQYPTVSIIHLNCKTISSPRAHTSQRMHNYGTMVAMVTRV